MLVQFLCFLFFVLVFFFIDTATTEIYTLSLHDALPIFATSVVAIMFGSWRAMRWPSFVDTRSGSMKSAPRSEEHTSELQSLRHLVCRLLLEKKKEKERCY